MPPRTRRRTPAATRAWSLAAVALTAVVAAASPAPPTAHGLLDALEGAGLAACTDRREPVPEVVTCVDDEGDLTIGIVDDALATVRSTASTVSGPWIVADEFVVITYDDDLARAQAIIDELGAGQLYTADDDDEPEPLEV